MSENTVSRLCLLVLCASILISTSSYGHSLKNSNKKVGLFIFGDSLYDNGNNNYIKTTAAFLANYPPYGQSFFKYPTGRFSDGRLIPDFIAGYANLPLIPPYLQPGGHNFAHGVNFASAGAGALAETYGGLVIDLKTQQRNFGNVEKTLRGKVGSIETRKMLSNAVYMLSIGGNDYAFALKTNSTKTRNQLVGMVIGNIKSMIKKIYRQGGRKFGILNVPPIGCFPSTKAIVGACFPSATMLAKLHNKNLHNVLQKLQRNLKGFKYSYTDFYTILDERINNPLLHGFKDGKNACCGTGPFRGVSSCGGFEEVKEFQLCSNPSNHVFFDAEHPTERANQQVASLMWSGTRNVTRPVNLKTLFEHQASVHLLES